MVTDNIARVKRRIEEAAGRSSRDPGAVKLIVVTKEADVGRMREALEAGVTDVGENRVKDAALKQSQLDRTGVTWHMIGHLQSNKAKDAVRLFSVIHSVETIKLAYTINKEAEKYKKTQAVLIEVNASGEESKFGIKPDALADFLEEARSLENLNILGLMTMAPFTDNAENTRPYFRQLKELAATHHLKELSMGMTQDFEVAIEEGATMVRIGSAIFRGES